MFHMGHLLRRDAILSFVYYITMHSFKSRYGTYMYVSVFTTVFHWSLS